MGEMSLVYFYGRFCNERKKTAEENKHIKPTHLCLKTSITIKQFYY